VTVKLLSPVSEVTLDGEYDAVVAMENGAIWELTCDTCDKNQGGTVHELRENGWSWQMSMDSEVKIIESKAKCPDCSDTRTRKSQITLDQVAAE
jgi:hypothetical protein